VANLRRVPPFKEWFTQLYKRSMLKTAVTNNWTNKNQMREVRSNRTTLTSVSNKIKEHTCTKDHPPILPDRV
jgi:hypothetical protein